MTNNIFSTLGRYSGSVENLLTESFVYLLNEVLAREPEQGKILLQRVIGKEDNLFTNDFGITVTTQLSLEEGRPDICIRTNPSSIFFIEVKHNSPLHKNQLENYYDELLKSGKSQYKLILLTRSKQTAIQTTLARNKFRHICWYEIYNWLSSIQSTNEIINYFIHDFLEFLEDKAMNLVKVEWEYPSGVKSLINLINMLQAAIEEVTDIKLKRTGGWFWRGYYINSVFCGVRYDRPNIIVFENNMGTNPTFKAELNIEKEHFLAFSKEEQFECLVKFVTETTEKFKNLNIVEPAQESLTPLEDLGNQ